MSNKLFDVLRILQIIVPALGTCYAALSEIWGLGHAQQIIESCAAVTALLGAFLQIQSARFFEGKEIVEKQEVGDDSELWA